MSEHQNNIESTSNTLETENTEQTSATAGYSQNSDFESMVEDATRTQEQEKQQAREEKQQEAPTAMSQEQAGHYAIQAIEIVSSLTAQATKKEIVMPDMVKGLLSMLMTPCIMKYGATIQRLMAAPKQAELDSKLPEILAALGVAGTGYIIYQQVSAPEQTETNQAAENGN